MNVEVALKRRLGEVNIAVDFASESGVTALFGRSGAGKTSVIKMISGLLRPDTGRIQLAGRVVFDSQAGINVPPRQRRIGYIFQESRLFPHLKVRTNLLYGQRFVPTDERYVRLDQVVELLGIGDLLARRPAELSGGERQRVAIGRALLTSPKLLLMDEPLASLDGARKNEILPYLERLRDELRLPIVYVSHQFDEVARLADRLVVMADGKQQAAGSLLEVASRLDLSRLTGADQAGAVIEARVAQHETAFGLTRLNCAAGELLVPLTDQPEGAAVRVQVRMADVAIATSRPSGISVQNVLPVRIESLTEEQGGSVKLRLDATGTCLLASVTRKSVVELGLEPGRDVYALIKSVAMARHQLL